MLFRSPGTQQLRDTALWIVSHRPEWGASLTGFLLDRLAAPSLTAAENAELQTLLAQLGKSSAVQELLGKLARDPGANAKNQQLALRAMTGAAVKDSPSAWLDALALTLASRDTDTVRLAVSAARALPQPKGGHAALHAALLVAARDATKDRNSTRLNSSH